jgi:hypothetical protein
MEIIKAAKRSNAEIVEAIAKRSFRIDEFSRRNSISRAQVYVELKEGRLRARKVGAATLITVEDETAWLNSLPAMNPSAA